MIIYDVARVMVVLAEVSYTVAFLDETDCL